MHSRRTSRAWRRWRQPVAAGTQASRADVVRALRSHNEALGHPAVDSLCDALNDPEAVVVIAGQQPGLFGGPLMLTLKAAAAVQLARSLADRTGRPVVPVFWNHGEDHDLDEVNQVTVVRDGSAVTSRAPIDGRGRSLQAIEIDDAVVDFARELVDQQRWPEAVIPRAGEAFPDWTSRVMLATLGDATPLIAEPRVLWPHTGDLFRRAIEDVADLGAAVAAGADRVAASGAPVQVVARDPSQLFAIDPDGTRRRLLATDGWQIDGAGTVTRDELVARATTDPTTLSCTVLLRPVAVQWALPVAAHVCGPAECAYFAQLPEIFAWAGLPVPAVIPRPMATVLGKDEERTRARLGIAPDDLLGDPEGWSDAAVSEEMGEAFAAVRANLAGSTDPATKLAGDHASLRAAIEGFHRKVDGALEKLEKTFTKEEQRAAGTSAKHRKHLQEWVRPRGRAQERILSAVALARGDLARLGQALLGVDPLAPHHNDLGSTMSDTQLDVLAFGAHPDDVDLTVGGTVSLLVSQGHRVGIVDMTRGEMGTRGTPETRAEEAQEAARILGAEVRESLGLPDGRVLLDDTSRTAVIRALRTYRPRLVLAPIAEDLHPDHKWTGVIVREAAFLAGLRRWDTGQEPHRPRTVLGYASHTLFDPDIVVDVTDHFETKRRACLAFKSQFHDPNSAEPATYIAGDRFWDWWEGRARHFGNRIGATFGEPLQHEGPIPGHDLVGPVPRLRLLPVAELPAID